MDFEHKSVLLKETVTALAIKAEGIYVDCTLGGGGHALAITEKLGQNGWFIGIDQDAAAIEAGRVRLRQAVCKVSIIQSNFHLLEAVLDSLQVTAADGVLFDLGVSSYQLDKGERGFSYMQNGPLDMRMDQTSRISAYDVVNNYSAQRLAAIISEYGEERWAKRIADFIIRDRANKPIETTAELVETIKKAIPAAARREGPHPAKRTFQAIRIEVNNELGILSEAIETAVARLKSGGRVVIITFHSLEDRIVKQCLQKMAKRCTCPKNFPVCVCGNKPKVKIISKPLCPSTAELEDNPRARSAKLRVAEKV